MSASDHALVVGIDGYSRLPPLRGAESDARAFASWLLDEKRGNLPPGNVTTLVSSDFPPAPHPTKARPMRDDVFSEIETIVVNAQADEKRRRRLYLYLAGHGFGPDIDEIALLMANAGTAVETFHNLPGVRYGNYFRKVPLFSEVVLVVDCCREHEERPPLVDIGLPAIRPRRSEAPYFYAFATKWSLRTREGLDESGKVRGHFTRALIEALDEPGATSRTVCKYVVGRLPELARRRGYYPPEFRCGKTISFGKRARRGGGEPPAVVNVLFDTPNPGVQLRILDNDEEIVVEGDMDESPWSVPLPRGLYELLRTDRGSQRTRFRVPATGSVDVRA